MDLKNHGAFINILKIPSAPDHNYVNRIVCRSER